MNDLGPNHTFMSNAFEPTAKEFKNATRRAPSRPLAPEKKPSTSKIAPPKKSYTSKEIDDLLDMSDSSDDELPDVSTLIKNRLSSPIAPSPKKPKKEEDVKMKITSSDEESETVR